MSIIVNLTEEEIMGTPNDMELGEKARQKYWIEKEHEIFHFLKSPLTNLPCLVHFSK
jgi:hypothetical protein